MPGEIERLGQSIRERIQALKERSAEVGPENLRLANDFYRALAGFRDAKEVFQKENIRLKALTEQHLEVGLGNAGSLFVTWDDDDPSYGFALVVAGQVVHPGDRAGPSNLRPQEFERALHGALMAIKKQIEELVG